MGQIVEVSLSASTRHFEVWPDNQNIYLIRAEEILPLVVGGFEAVENLDYDHDVTMARLTPKGEAWLRAQQTQDALAGH